MYCSRTRNLQKEQEGVIKIFKVYNDNSIYVYTMKVFLVKKDMKFKEGISE